MHSHPEDDLRPSVGKPGDLQASNEKLLVSSDFGVIVKNISIILGLNQSKITPMLFYQQEKAFSYDSIDAILDEFQNDPFLNYQDNDYSHKRVADIHNNSDLYKAEIIYLEDNKFLGAELEKLGTFEFTPRIDDETHIYTPT